MPGSPVLHYLLKFAQTHVHPILCRPLLLLPSIFPRIRVFSSESALLIRWLKYWSFSISPSNEYSEFISFRIDWFDLLAVFKDSELPYSPIKQNFNLKSTNLEFGDYRIGLG